MKYRISGAIKGSDKKPIKNEDGTLFTYAQAISTSLLAQPKDDNSTPDDKYKRYKIAMKCMDADSVDLTMDEIKIVKDLVGKVYTTYTIGKVYDFLETEGKVGKA